MPPDPYPCSFKKRRGHSVGGIPEQRYQSIPVCAAAQLPVQAQDVLVREEPGLMWGAGMGVQAPAQVGQGSKAGHSVGATYGDHSGVLR